MRGQGLPLETIVIAALVVIVAIIGAITFIPGISNIFGTIGGVSGTGGNASFISECSTRCTNLDYKYSSVSTADSAATNNFCNYEDSAGRGCQVYIECQFHLSGGSDLRKIQKMTTGECMITAAGCTVACNQNSDCGDANECTTDICNNPKTCEAECANTPNTGACSGGVCCSGSCCLSSFGDCCSGSCVAAGSNQNCNGMCSVCISGQDCCSGTCISTTSDKNNCGDCGISCASMCQGHNPNSGSEYCINSCCHCLSGVPPVDISCNC